jgi:abhydrolase domain-containing protein 13
MQKFLMAFLAFSFLRSTSMPYWQLGLMAVAGAACFLYSIYAYQENLLYQPTIAGFKTPSQNPPNYKNPSEHGIPYKNVYFTTSDSKRLHGWLLLQEGVAAKTAPTILYFHANAGNMGFRLDYLAELHRMKCNVFIVSYRGYGESEGEPSEEGLYKDADAALTWLQECKDVDKNKILIFGRSLGGAVAIFLSSKRGGEVAGTILENTFTSIGDMADLLFPVLAPLKGLILRMHFNSLERIKRIEHPILFISGLSDEVVPAVQMAALYEASQQSKRAVVLRVPGGMHNDTWKTGSQFYVDTFRKFVHGTVSPDGPDEKKAQSADGESSDSEID